MKEVAESTAAQKQLGRWVTERVYAEIYGLNYQTLCNWRYRDRKAGRNCAPPGFPQYRRFGRAVRYWLESSPVPGLAA
jgi:hypothetical protein